MIHILCTRIRPSQTSQHDGCRQRWGGRRLWRQREKTLKQQQNYIKQREAAGGGGGDVEQTEDEPTEGGVLAELHVVALEALLGSPAVVASSHDEVHLLVAVLTHVPTEDPASAVPADRVSTVHRAAPHVPDPVGVDLRPGLRVAYERVVRRDPVGSPIRVQGVHIDTQRLPQQSTPGGGRGLLMEVNEAEMSTN